MKKITIAALALFLSDAALACTPLRSDADYINILNTQRSLIVVSQNRNFFLKLIPSKWAWEKGRMVKKRDSYALAFEALPYGQQKQLWSYKHWDANAKRPNLYLSNDGMNLVEVNANVSSLQDTSAVVTYRKGQKSQTYPPSTFGVTKLKPQPCRNQTWLNDLVKNDRAIQAVNGSHLRISPETLAIRQAK